MGMYRMGNGAAKEPTLMTHRGEQWCGYCLREWGVLGGGRKKGENWDDGNSIKSVKYNLKIN